MSRTKHKLRSEDWYGNWAAYFHKENRHMRRIGREKRRRDSQRVDGELLDDELDRDGHYVEYE